MKTERTFFSARECRMSKNTATEFLLTLLNLFAHLRNIFQKMALMQHVGAKELVNARRANDTEG
jgi:hypothetical protein